MRFRATLETAFAVLVMSTLAYGQLTEQYEPPRANCCLAGAARNLANELLDWNQLGRYHAANQELKQQPADPKRVVFMGDSITDGWRLSEYFPDKPYVNRGISGQTTPQMLVRMYPDVIDLKPAAVVILAGTNDIAQNTGPETAEMVQQNITAMTVLAQQNGVKVVLCAVMPVSNYPLLEGTKRRRPAALAVSRPGPAVPAGTNDPYSPGSGYSRAERVVEGLCGACKRGLCGLLLRHGGRQGVAEGRYLR